MKIKKVVILVVFLSAFLCACHENYSAQKEEVQETNKTASGDMTEHYSDSIETTFKI